MNTIVITVGDTFYFRNKKIKGTITKIKNKLIYTSIDINTPILVNFFELVDEVDYKWELTL